MERRIWGPIPVSNPLHQQVFPLYLLFPFTMDTRCNSFHLKPPQLLPEPPTPLPSITVLSGRGVFVAVSNSSPPFLFKPSSTTLLTDAALARIINGICVTAPRGPSHALIILAVADLEAYSPGFHGPPYTTLLVFLLYHCLYPFSLLC